ncbi:alpha/beta hydrolase [Bacillus sp. Cs-700]|uniref:alpha/beta fold hydrolase n=1 Tax=Bacillus sp. Cs-700 TaxID=2589818 RepID=UPI00140990A7|nr:alpha/beta hydrolase [Bacillus sp. Cs-700]
MTKRIYFLHGFMGTGDLHFEHQKAFFERDMEVIALSLPGHGHSTIPAFENYFESALEWVIEEVTNKGPGYVVGLSLGASLAIHLAIKRPELIKGAVLTGYSPSIPDDLKSIMEEQYTYFNNIQENDEETAASFKQLHGDKWFDTLQKVNKIMTFHYPSVSEKEIAELEVPIMVLNGGNELYEVESVQFLKRSNDKINVGLIPDAGHTANMDQPNLYNSMVQQFINK